MCSTTWADLQPRPSPSRHVPPQETNRGRRVCDTGQNKARRGDAGLSSSASWTDEKSFPFLLGVCMDPIAGSCSSCSPAPWRPPHTLPSLAFHITPCASRKQASLILLLYSNHDGPQWMTRLLLPENIPAAHAAISWLCPPATRVLGNVCWWSRYLVLEKCKTILRFLRIIYCRQPCQDPLAFKSFF